MAKIVPLDVYDNNSGNESVQKKVYFEYSDVDIFNKDNNGGWVRASSGSVPDIDVIGSLNHALDSVSPVAKAVFDTFRALGEASPKEIEITLGLKLSGKVGFFVAESQGEGSLNVKLKWSK